MRALLLLLAACGVGQEIKGLGGDLAEVSYCEFADCGQVYLCTMPDGSKDEWCYGADGDALRDVSGAVSCEPTPRGGALGWPCLYSCPAQAHGCNAYQGCYCE